MSEIQQLIKRVNDLEERFAKMQASVGQTIGSDFDPEAVPLLDNPGIWSGDWVTHHGLCKKHKECALFHWASKPDDPRGPVLIHVERPPEFNNWQLPNDEAATAKWLWLDTYLPIQAHGNRSLEITKQGEQDGQRKTDFQQALDTQYQLQRNYKPPVNEGWGISGFTQESNLPGVELPEGSDMGHGAEASGSTQPKTGMDGETGR